MLAHPTARNTTFRVESESKQNQGQKFMKKICSLLRKRDDSFQEGPKESEAPVSFDLMPLFYGVEEEV